MADRKDLFTETITEVQNIGEVQNQSRIAMFGNRRGEIVIEWGVAGAMVRDSQETDLDVGTYKILAPSGVDDANESTWDNFFIPAGTIITACHVHTHEAKAGSGTITPAFGDDVLTAIDAAGYNDDTSALAAQLIAADADFSVAIAGTVVTAGAFTIVLDVINGNVD
jgi:hypothetical protein